MDSVNTNTCESDYSDSKLFFMRKFEMQNTIEFQYSLVTFIKYGQSTKNMYMILSGYGGSSTYKVVYRVEYSDGSVDEAMYYSYDY